MKQEIIDSYRNHFEELKLKFKEIEKLVKEEATQDVSAFMFENRFDESQAAVGYLKNLLTNISFEINFDNIENSIKEYNHQMKTLRSKDPFFIPTLTPHKQTKQVASNVAFNNSSEAKKQGYEQKSFLDFVQSTLPKHKFNVVKVQDNDFELEKNKKHYYMTLVKPDLTKDDYVNILERMNEKKNIGFICENEENMKLVQSFANEWVESSPDYKTKFLSIHFTTVDKLESETESIFETYNY